MPLKQRQREDRLVKREEMWLENQTILKAFAQEMVIKTLKVHT